jgi:hypothetical protein
MHYGVEHKSPKRFVDLVEYIKSYCVHDLFFLMIISGKTTTTIMAPQVANASTVKKGG